MIGETLNHYRILAQIGVGGMGAVYRAEDQKLRREVALKLLPATLAESPERLDRFQREARAVAQLNHPNIVTLFSVEEDKGRHFITMELVKGSSLGTSIPRGGMMVKEFFGVAISIADALAAAHEKGITHRDLKPANVMLDERGRVKVIDFGLAKATATETSDTLSKAPTVVATVEGRIMGTPSYMSPEQVEGRPVDHRSDLFSLGILFHEMLTGDRPFKGDSNMSVMSSILKDEPATVSSLRPEIPQELTRLTRRCLQKMPDDRAQSALDVRNELKELKKEFLSGTLSSSSVSRVSSKTGAGAGVGGGASKGAARVWGWAGVGVASVLVVLGVFAFRGKRGETPSVAVQPPGVAVPTGFPQITRLSESDRMETMPAWSPDGKQLAFVSLVGNTRQIFIRDANPRQGVAVQLTKDNHDHLMPCWGPDTNTIYYVQSIRAGETVGLWQAKGGGHVMENAEIMLHDLRDQRVRDVMPHAISPTVAPGGKELFFVQQSRVFKSDLLGRRPLQLTQDEELIWHEDPRVSFDGSKVVYRRLNPVEETQEIMVVTTNRVVTTLATRGYNVFPTWHPSGRYVYFSKYSGSGMNIWRLPLTLTNTPSGRAEPVTVGGGHDQHAAFSPDGKRMVFSISSQNADVYRVSIDPATGKTNGPPAERMPFNSNQEDSRASWAPNAEQPMVAFNSDRNGDMNIYIWREKDNSVTQVTSGPGGDYQPTWSPDLQKLVLFSSRSGNSEIFVVGTNANSKPVQLTQNPGFDINPFFSPDGKQIAFASERGEGPTVYVMNSDGSGQRPIMSNLGFGHFLPWFDKDSLFKVYMVNGQYDFHRVFTADGRVERVNTISPSPNIGGHGSFAPDRRHYMDLDAPHARIWVISLSANEGGIVYQKPPSAAQIDYPWWSSDGRWATFDLTVPKNSELFIADWDDHGGR